jgi:hypothetical protein
LGRELDWIERKKWTLFFSQRKTIKKESSAAQAGQGVMARFPVIFLYHKAVKQFIKK